MTWKTFSTPPDPGRVVVWCEKWTKNPRTGVGTIIANGDFASHDSLQPSAWTKPADFDKLLRNIRWIYPPEE